MEDPESPTKFDDLPPFHESILTKLTTKIIEALTKAQTSMITTETSATPISIKLDGSNALLSQVVDIYISGEHKLGYINDDSPKPPQTDSSFRKWRTDNAIIKGRLINSY